MAAEAPAIVISAIAAADLSAGQYRGVKVTAAQSVNFVAGSTDKSIGILQNKPTSGQMATVMVDGVTKAEAGAAIAAGAVVMFNASGKVITATATNQGIGVALTAAGADQDLITVVLRYYGTQ